MRPKGVLEPPQEPVYISIEDEYINTHGSVQEYPDYRQSGAEEKHYLEPLKTEVPAPPSTARPQRALGFVLPMRDSKKRGCKQPPCWGWILIVIGIGILGGLIALSVWLFTSMTCSPTSGYPTMMPDGVFVDCKDAYDNGRHTSGVYRTSPDGDVQMEVYCEQRLDGGGWAVIQRRQYGNVSFFRNWADYKSGFGDLTGDFWLGNDYIHILTDGRHQKLKIEMTHPNGTLAIADYLDFWLENETMKYRLRVSGFSHTVPPGDAFGYHNGMYFSTFDHDNDISKDKNCADTRHGGWWYHKCHWANLNGIYGAASNAGINWSKFTNYNKSLTSVRMMVKTQ